MTRSLPRTRPRRLARAVGVLTASLVVSVSVALAGAGPAAAHGDDHDRAQKVQREYDEGTNVPLVNSPNVNFVTNFPESAAISGCFAKTAPYFYVSSLDSVSVFDTSDPTRPQLTGTLDNLTFENEAMTCGERKQGRTTQRFVLIGVDLHQASTDDVDHVNTGGGQELVVVDVTDPSDPTIRSRVPAATGTHTVACVVDTDCRYAYSSGDDGDEPGTGSFSVFDLTDLDNPREVDSEPATPALDPFESPTAGHKWNFDNAGYGIHTGYDGSGMFDVSDPLDPRLVTTTGTAGQGTHADYPGYNDFIHHNSFRPNADGFEPHSAPSYQNGNVLLVTEEDYMQTDCTKAGSFQAWHVKSLDGTPDAVVPLDKVELSDLGSFPVPEYAFCSAHWFDWHQSGIVAVGFYGGGLQLVDARDPENLKAYGHASWGLSEVWDAYWVPVYNKQERATEQKTNVVYTVDLARGLDVYTVDLPGAGSSSSGTVLSRTTTMPAQGVLPTPPVLTTAARLVDAILPWA
ncbi:MAG TPA: hypothetical protein VHG70_08390 [Nocardioidaceae bacterium]|nr:hypothetical protein [Nocardioidaceae bacterium]